jgi:pimeloyl-ACP methyl ester carboxylesterase
MVALTPTWTRECEVIDGLENGVARFANLPTPTLLLVGTATARHHVEASDALDEALPNARSVELEGQGHQAHLTATRDFAAAVNGFLQP